MSGRIRRPVLRGAHLNLVKEEPLESQSSSGAGLLQEISSTSGPAPLPQPLARVSGPPALGPCFTTTPSPPPGGEAGGPTGLAMLLQAREKAQEEARTSSVGNAALRGSTRGAMVCDETLAMLAGRGGKGAEEERVGPSAAAGGRAQNLNVRAAGKTTGCEYAPVTLPYLHLPGEMEDRESMVFLQVPSLWPMPNAAEPAVGQVGKEEGLREEGKKEGRSLALVGLDELPEGEIGVLKIYKKRSPELILHSGEGSKIQLKLLKGSKVGFAEEVLCVLPQENEACLLGHVGKDQLLRGENFVVSPDVEAMLQSPQKMEDAAYSVLMAPYRRGSRALGMVNLIRTRQQVEAPAVRCPAVSQSLISSAFEAMDAPSSTPGLAYEDHKCQSFVTSIRKHAPGSNNVCDTDAGEGLRETCKGSEELSSTSAEVFMHKASHMRDLRLGKQVKGGQQSSDETRLMVRNCIKRTIGATAGTAKRCKTARKAADFLRSALDPVKDQEASKPPKVASSEDRSEAESSDASSGSDGTRGQTKRKRTSRRRKDLRGQKVRRREGMDFVSSEESLLRVPEGALFVLDSVGSVDLRKVRNGVEPKEGTGSSKKRGLPFKTLSVPTDELRALVSFLEC